MAPLISPIQHYFPVENTGVDKQDDAPPFRTERALTTQAAQFGVHIFSQRAASPFSQTAGSAGLDAVNAP